MYYYYSMKFPEYGISGSDNTGGNNMSLFDKLQEQTRKNDDAPQTSVQEGTFTFTFSELPENLEQMQSLPESCLDTPYKTAALAICALCCYAVDKENGTKMLEFLRGLKGALSTYEVQFLKDRLSGQQYVPFSYFEGARPENDYRPAEPYRITLYSDPYSFSNEGYAKLNIRSGGADSPRQIQLRRKGNQWFLWEQFVLVGIRRPASQDPWS